MTKQKVLVFDDSENHRKAAILLLGKDYDITVVSTYEEAQAALTPKKDYDNAEQLRQDLLEKAGLKRDFHPLITTGASASDKEKYRAAYKEADELATTYPNFDIVLTDLLVPAPGQAQGGPGLEFVGQEMPLGTTIALLALYAGVKKVAVVTDMNHHHHPASAAFDYFQRGCRLDDVKIVCTNDPGSVYFDEKTGKLVARSFLDTDEGKEKYPYFEGSRSQRRDLNQGKDWKQVLLQLTGKPKEE